MDYEFTPEEIQDLNDLSEDALDLDLSKGFSTVQELLQAPVFTVFEKQILKVVGLESSVKFDGQGALEVLREIYLILESLANMDLQSSGQLFCGP